MTIPVELENENLKLESHNSLLTNQRIHEIERALDLWNIRMHQEITQDSLLACHSIIVAWFSYVKSMLQRRQTDPTVRKSDFEYRVVAIEDKIACASKFAAFIQKKIETDVITDIYREIGSRECTKNFWNILEYKMFILIEEIIDDMRLLYQSVHFYFRISKGTGIGGVLGDLVNIKNKRGTIFNEGDETNESESIPENSENNNQNG